MTWDKVLQYLGVRRAPGTERTTTDRVWTVAMIAVILVAMFLTRDLDSWPQFGVLIIVAVVFGVLSGAALTAIAARRSRSDADE